MQTLSNREIDQVEKALEIELPRFYRKLLIEIGFGESDLDNELYHPSKIFELYEFKFDNEELLFKKYFPFGCNNPKQELWIIDIELDRACSIDHETHEDDWPFEQWLEYETWLEKNEI